VATVAEACRGIAATYKKNTGTASNFMVTEKRGFGGSRMP
jgi:hypothetical protein